MRDLRDALLLLAACAGLASCGPSGGSTGPAAPVTGTSLRYGIEGMHCDGCVQAITDKVRHVDGVIDCRVSLQDRLADVTVREASSAPAVRQAIEKLGYKVTPEAGNAAATAASPSTPPTTPASK